jgi:hypothetical protein
MGIVIVGEEERREFKLAGATFHYKPCGWGRYQEIQRQNRNDRTLVVDQVAVDRMLVEQHVLAWDGVVDSAGKPVPFDLEHLKKLPPVVFVALAEKVVDAVLEEEEQQGNSDGSSST